MIIEPIYRVPVRVLEIVDALEKLIAAGAPQIPDPPDGNWKAFPDFLPRSAGVKSWKALAKGAQEYAILWEAERIRLVPSMHDRQGRFVLDWDKEKQFPKDTSLSTIVEAMLEDARTHPELELTADEASP